MSKVKAIPQKYIDKIVEHSPYASVISTSYVNQDTIIDVYCKKHNIRYKNPLRNLLRHNGCEECTKDIISQSKGYTTDKFKKIVYSKNPHIKVLGEYTKQGCRIPCKCLIHNIEFSPLSQSLIQGNGGCPTCNLEKLSRPRRTSDDLKASFHDLNPSLKIIDDNIRLNTWIKVYCTVCKQYFNKMLSVPFVSNRKCCCPICTNKIIIEGFNDVNTRRPDLVKYFKNKDDAKIYGPGMTKKLKFVCPDCGHEKALKLEVLARNGFGCLCCGDGISYPNKFMRSALRQLNVKNLDFEYSPDWAGKYFYDCYFEHNGYKYVVEVDGQQHFKSNSNFKMTLDDVQKRDKEKTILAENNRHILIRINAEKSNKDYLFCQINNSLLSKLFNLNIVNWEKCDIDATNNLAKEVCIYAEKTMPNKYKDICQNFCLCEDTIRKYLKQGVKYRWCSNKLIEKLTVPKRISVYDYDNNLLYIFNGIKKCSEEMSNICNDKFSQHSISNNCYELVNNYKGYVFKFTYKTM